MNGWIIYNGALRIKKVEKLVYELFEKAKKKNVKLQMVRNNEILPSFDSYGKAQLNSTINLSNPDFIIFWDKDIYLARHLELMGYTLFNSREAIELCDNKSLMHLKLANLNIRIPKTIVGPFVFQQQNLNEDYIDFIFSHLGNKVIIKESYGSFGMQVYLVNNKNEFKDKVMQLQNRSFIVQEFIETSFGRDIRVNIIGDEIVGAMQRTSSADFRTNITLGGIGKFIDLSDEQKEMALKAHKALNLDFSGIDLLFGTNDEPILCEVNSNVNFLSFEEISNIDFGDKLIDYVITRIK